MANRYRNCICQIISKMTSNADSTVSVSTCTMDDALRSRFHALVGVLDDALSVGAHAISRSLLAANYTSWDSCRQDRKHWYCSKSWLVPKIEAQQQCCSWRSSTGQKSRQIRIQPEGKSDGTCPRKNGWNDSTKDLVPQILNINIVDWEGQKPKAMQKLQDSLDYEFEYLENPLNMQGFWNIVKQYLKFESLRLKVKYRLELQ